MTSVLKEEQRLRAIKAVGDGYINGGIPGALAVAEAIILEALAASQPFQLEAGDISEAWCTDANQRRSLRMLVERRDAAWGVQLALAQGRAEAAEREAEQRTVQLAGVSVAAMGGTSEPMLATRGMYGWSVPYQDTLELRLKYDALGARLVTIVDEAFFMQPVQSVDETLTVLERELFKLRQEAERATPAVPEKREE